MAAFDYLQNALLIILSSSFIYCVFLYMVTSPFMQRQLLFLHNIPVPLFAEYDKPAKYGLPGHRTFNLKLRSLAGKDLGAWLLFPPSSRSPIKDSAFSFLAQKSLDDFRTEFSTKTVILFLHGNAASRAMFFRVQLINFYATRFDAIVLTIDYQGFGDSEGTPSEAGILLDTRAAWDFVISQGADPSQVLIVGHSLGTGSATGLGGWLAQNEVTPKGIVLLSPFTSIEEVIENYSFFGVFTLFAPLRYLPSLKKYILSFLQHRFPNSTILPSIKAPIVVAHANNDHDIPFTNSRKIFNKLIIDSLGDTAASVLTSHQQFIAEANFYGRLFEDLCGQGVDISAIKAHEADHGIVYELHRKNCDSKAILLETQWGGHDRFGSQAVVVDVISQVFDIPNSATTSSR